MEPNIRIKGFDGDWEERSLGEIFSFQNGFNGGKEVYGSGVPLISVMDVLDDDFITYDKIRGKAEVSEEELERFSVKYGDVLFQRSSENVEDAGTSNVYLDPDHTAVFGGFVIRGRGIADYDPAFMKYCLSTPLVRAQFMKKAQGAQHVNVSQEILQDIQIHEPSNREQEKISELLSCLGQQISLQQQKVGDLKELKKCMLQKMFPKDGEQVPEIRFGGFEGQWEQRKLGNCFKFLQNNTLSRAELSTETGVALNIHYGDVLIRYGEFLDTSSEQMVFIPDQSVVDKYKESHLINGDVIMADTAEDETVGKCSEIAGLEGKTAISGLHTIPLRPVEKFAPGFLGYYMNSGAYHDQLLPLMQGIKVTSVSKNAIRNTDIFFPADISEQAAIGQFFIQLDSLITHHQRRHDTLLEFKAYLLQNMFPKEG